jgi:hypothetical protein
LVLEPFARVALVDAGGFGKLGGSGWPAIGEDAVEPEPVAQVNAVEIEGGNRSLEDPLGERVPRAHGANLTE